MNAQEINDLMERVYKVNDERRRKGLPPITSEKELDRLEGRKADDGAVVVNGVTFSADAMDLLNRRFIERERIKLSAEQARRERMELATKFFGDAQTKAEQPLLSYEYDPLRNEHRLKNRQGLVIHKSQDHPTPRGLLKAMEHEEFKQAGIAGTPHETEMKRAAAEEESRRGRFDPAISKIMGQVQAGAHHWEGRLQPDAAQRWKQLKQSLSLLPLSRRSISSIEV